MALTRRGWDLVGWMILCMGVRILLSVEKPGSVGQLTYPKKDYVRPESPGIVWSSSDSDASIRSNDQRGPSYTKCLRGCDDVEVPESCLNVW